MKYILLIALISCSLSILVFPFKERENDAKTFASPVNKTKIPILKYLYHLLNDFEFVSDIDVGIPKQKVELKINFDDNYLTLLQHLTSPNPYYYNLSSSYKEIKIKDKDCPLKVKESTTINEILHMKNKFYDNLKDFLDSKDEVSHEFTIIFTKLLPTLKKIVTYQFWDSNSVNFGLRTDVRYNGEHGIYKPFLDEVKDQGFIENNVFFLYYFNEYELNLYKKNKNEVYDGLIVFGKHPHELLPNEFDIKNLFWTNTFLTRERFSTAENILWGVKFNQVYIDYGNNNKQQFEFLRGVFDLNVEYIFPPYLYYETIKNFFRPLRKICFIDSNDRLFNKDENIYRMIYCDYEEFGKKYLKTFPKLVFKIDDFDEEFEFTYEDLFKPIYDNKYYLFLIFTGRFWRASELIIQPPSYPWTLGRLFFKKYQFVFDYLNKKVGYYKNKNDKNYQEPKINNVEEKENKNLENKENNNQEKENIKKSDDKKEKKIDIKNMANNSNNEKEAKNLKPANIHKENNFMDKSFLTIIIIVLSIIMVLAIGFCYECKIKKDKRKKRTNELIDKEDNKPEVELDDKNI